jgi:hypothetical protein
MDKNYKRSVACALRRVAGRRIIDPISARLLGLDFLFP